MTVRADLDTIRKAVMASLAFTTRHGYTHDDFDAAHAALDRLAGCVILTRQEAETFLRGGSVDEIAALVALLDARLGETVE